MKILHINLTDSGGAGIAARRLHIGLKSLGIDSTMLVLNKKSSDDAIVEFEGEVNLVIRQLNKVLGMYISSRYDSYKKNIPPGLEPFTYDRTIYAVSKHHLVKEADILHLHWIAKLVDYRDFFPAADKPVIWTLHDMNPFTGGCHYAGECKKYQNRCGCCPWLNSNDQADLSSGIFRRKEKSYAKADISVVSPSRWLAGCAESSSLFKRHQIDIIPYGIPTSIFNRRDKPYSRQLLNLPRAKTLILFSANYKTRRKGFDYLMRAFILLKDRINLDNIALVIVGNCISTLPEDIEVPIYQLGHIEDELLMSCCYSASDLLVIPSLEDNLPSTVLEAMSCGIPVVGFDTGGIPDMVKPKITGLLAGKGDCEELAEKIQWLVEYPRERIRMGENARKMVEKEYTLERQARRYLELYRARFGSGRDV